MKRYDLDTSVACRNVRIYGCYMCGQLYKTKAAMSINNRVCPNCEDTICKSESEEAELDEMSEEDCYE